jgi:hypothetical protein
LLGVKYIIISHQDPAKQSNCSGRSDLNSSLSVQTSLCVTLSYGKQLPELRDLDLNHFSGSPAKSELLVAKTQRVPALYNGVRHAAPVEPTDHERPVRMPRPVSFAPLTRSEEVFPCAGRRTKSLEPSPSITPGAVHHGSVGLQTQRFTIPSYNSRCTNKCSVSVFAACWVTNLLIRYNLCQPAVAAHTSTLLTLIRWSG